MRKIPSENYEEIVTQEGGFDSVYDKNSDNLVTDAMLYLPLNFSRQARNSYCLINVILN